MLSEDKHSMMGHGDAWFSMNLKPNALNPKPHAYAGFPLLAQRSSSEMRRIASLRQLPSALLGFT